MRATLRVERIALRMRAPLRTAGGSHSVREGARITLTDEGGIIALGEAMPLERFGTEALPRTLAALGALGAGTLELGEDPWELGPALAPLDALPAARHALELAALDLQARRAGVSLASWLGRHAPGPVGALAVGARSRVDPPATSIPVNALLSAQAPDALAAEGLQATEQGARTLKVKVAGGPIAQDVLRLRTLREAVGPTVRLRLDANGGWRRPEASRALAALCDACAPELCEQPVDAEDVDGLGALRREGHCPIGADEALASPARAAEVIERGAADAVILKPMVLGGLLPALRLGLMARSRGLHAIVTSSLDGVIARAGAAHLAAVIGEADWAHGLWVGPLFVDEPAHPYAPVRGAIVLPLEPGLGLSADSAEAGRRQQ